MCEIIDFGNEYLNNELFCLVKGCNYKGYVALLNMVNIYKKQGYTDEEIVKTLKNLIVNERS